MVLTYEQIKELGHEPSSWEVAPDRRRPAIGWTGAHDSVSEFPQTPPSKFHKGIAQPKITSFGTITDRQEQSQEPASSRAPKSTREWAPRPDEDNWRQNDWGDNGWDKNNDQWSKDQWSPADPNGSGDVSGDVTSVDKRAAPPWRQFATLSVRGYEKKIRRPSREQNVED